MQRGFARVKFLFSLIILLYIPLYSLPTESPLPAEPDKVHIARLEYTGIYDYTSIKNWYTDYPAMENNLVPLINRLTGIRTTTAKVEITKDIFNYPLIYIVEPAQMNLSESDTPIMQEYFMRGGFAVFDDIHGDEDLEPVRAIFTKLFPEADQLVPLTIKHPIFHVFFELNEIVQATNDGIAMCPTCEQWENGPSGRVPVVFAHYDDAGQINALVFHNNDLGDAGEWLDDPLYPRQMAIFSVKMLSDVMIWALSH